MNVSHAMNYNVCYWLVDKFLQVENFKYLDHEISYENGKDIQQRQENLLSYWEL